MKKIPFVFFFSIILILLFLQLKADLFTISHPIKHKVTIREEETPPRPDQPDEAALEEYLLRSPIGGTFSYPLNWRFVAFRQINSAFRILKAQSGLSWQERGPSGIGGRTRVVVVHPHQPGTWWVGSVGGGIWFTQDAGQSWICQTDNMPVLAVSTIAICDSQPDILYAGTGEGFYNHDAIVGDGIFKTVDGGAHWRQLSSTAGNYDFRFVNRIVVHPSHPDTLLAVTKTGVMRSMDGGQSWQKVFDNGSNVQQIVCNPQNFNSLLITVWKSGVYKSVNMGDSWQLVSQAIEAPTRIEVAFAPGDTNLVYAAAADTNYQALGLFKSRDGGRSWINLGDSVNWLHSQGWYDNTILVHPFDPEIVFVGGVDIYRVDTHNDSAVYFKMTAWYHSNTYPYVHADQHCLAAIAHADSTFELVATNDGGIFYSPDGGNSWQARNRDFNVTQFYDADRNPVADQYLGGTQDNGTLFSPVNPTATTLWETKIGGDGFDCAWDKENPDIVFATLYSSRVYRSISGGDYFGQLSGVPESHIFHTPLVMDSHNSKKLITASDTNKIYISWDSGSNWTPVDVDFGGYRWIRLAISEKDSNVVWAASSSRHINVSTDGGRHFHHVENPVPDLHAYLTGIATSPFDSATALVMFGIYGYGKIFRTNDLGQTWEDITSNLPEIPVHCALFMPYDSSQIWIGTDLGVFISYNNGQSWQYAAQNLPAVSVRRMKIVGKQIVAATHGRGVWTVDNDTLVTYNLPTKEPILADLPLANPNTDFLKIAFRTQGAYDSLKIFDDTRVLSTFYAPPAYRDTVYFYKITPPCTVHIRVEGYKGQKVYLSETKTRIAYAARDSITLSFDDGTAPFSGDLRVCSNPGFASKTLDTDHPYQDGRAYIALLNNPITIGDSTHLHYRDMAIVEPGDDGYYYPYPQMWDYVTVEASADGENWQIVITPYDSRLQSEWLSAFKQNRAPDPGAFVSHDTTLYTIFAPGTKIYMRFRLFADGANHGWGWTIDDLYIGQGQPTALASVEQRVFSFRLLGNYPNPFNPSTTIRFTLDKASRVNLTIYNALGETVRHLLKHKAFQSSGLYRISWDGKNDFGSHAPSGIYFYRLQAGPHRAFGKMILIK